MINKNECIFHHQLNQNDLFTENREKFNSLIDINLHDMKTLYFLISMLLFNCSAQSKLKIETILKAPKKVIHFNEKGDSIDTIMRYVEVTPRYDHQINLLATGSKKIRIQLQGSIYSSGRNIQNVKKIHLVKTIQNENLVTLQYVVEIKSIAGKEGANVNGYNYRKELCFTTPKEIERVEVELYENRLNKPKPPKLVAKTMLENLKNR